MSLSKFALSYFGTQSETVKLSKIVHLRGGCLNWVKFGRRNWKPFGNSDIPLLVIICAFIIWMGYFKIQTKMVSTHNWSPQNVSAYYHYCNNTKRGTAKRRTPPSLLSKKLLHNSPFYMVKSCFLKNTEGFQVSSRTKIATFWYKKQLET